MRLLRRPPSAALLLALVLLWGCGDGAPGEASSGGASGADGGLSAEQMEKGVGPVQHVDLGPAIDPALAKAGREQFTVKCSACHKLDERYVGPPLRDVAAKRAPEFVMNMILNPAEMLERHPEARALLAEFLTPMPNQGLTPEQARAVLEYLREEQARGATP